MGRIGRQEFIHLFCIFSLMHCGTDVALYKTAFMLILVYYVAENRIFIQCPAVVMTLPRSVQRACFS